MQKDLSKLVEYDMCASFCTAILEVLRKDHCVSLQVNAALLCMLPEKCDFEIRFYAVNSLVQGGYTKCYS